MKKLICYLILFFSTLILFAQNQDPSFLKLGERLNFLNTIGTDTILFLHPSTKDTVYTKGSANLSVSDTFLVNRVMEDSIILSIQATTFLKVEFLEVKPFKEEDEEKPKGEVVYETSLDLNNTYHVYRLRKEDKYFTVEICRLVNSNGQVKLKCKTSNVPLIGDYDCEVHFKAIFLNTIEALYYDVETSTQASEWTGLQTYLNNSFGINKTLDLCYKGKDEVRQNIVNSKIENLQNDFSSRLENLKREDAGIMTMKDSVEVSYCITDLSRKSNTNKCNKIKKKIEDLKKEINELRNVDNFNTEAYLINTQFQKKLDKLSKLQREYENECITPCYISKYSTEKLTFKPEKLWFKTDFYRVSDIRLDGTLIKENENEPDIKVPISLINEEYGFGINGLTGGDDKEFAIKKFDVEIDGEFYDIQFNIGEIIDYNSCYAFFVNCI